MAGLRGLRRRRRAARGRGGGLGGVEVEDEGASRPDHQPSAILEEAPARLRRATTKETTAWLREEWALPRVAAVARAREPTARSSASSVRPRTLTTVSSGTHAPFVGCSRTRRGRPVGTSKSRTRSL